MVLQSSQQKHFYHIFHPFMAYVLDYLLDYGLTDYVPSPLRMPGMSEVYEVIDAIWGKGGHLEIIDAFVDDPTVPLNRTDKSIVAGWREGIFGEFWACKEGSDVVFLYDDYAFCVRGITDEIDEVASQFPGLLTTVIVPFDGIITYLVCLKCAGTGFSEELQEEMGAWVHKAKADKRYARTARQFMVCAPEARASAARHAEERAAEQAEFESHVDDVLEGEHRGVLAGLAWEERQRRFQQASREAAERLASSIALTTIGQQCLDGRPEDCLAKVIAKYGAKALRELAQARGVEDDLTRQELIDYFMAAYPPDAVKTLADLRLQGFQSVDEMRTMVEAKGRLHVKGDGTTQPADIPHPIFPWISYFREEDGYVAVSPREIVGALEGTDWDAELARAERLDEALAWLAVAVDMRGVIEVDEAVRALAERYPDVDVAEAEEALRRRSSSGHIEIACVTVDDQEYLLAPDLYDLDSKSILVDDVRTILSMREDVPPYWPTEEEGRLGIFAASMEKPEVQALMRYLDEHVPDGESDLVYANLIWGTIVSAVRVSLDMGADLAEILNRLGGSEVQTQHIAELTLKALHTLPSRSTNGYSFLSYYREVAPDKRPQIVVSKL